MHYRRPNHDNGLQNNEEVITLPDLLFVRALTIGIEEKRIQEQQQVDRNLFEEWKRIHQCKEEDGVLFQKGALVVTGGKKNYQDLLK